MQPLHMMCKTHLLKALGNMTPVDFAGCIMAVVLAKWQMFEEEVLEQNLWNGARLHDWMGAAMDGDSDSRASKRHRLPMSFQWAIE